MGCGGWNAGLITPVSHSAPSTPAQLQITPTLATRIGQGRKLAGAGPAPRPLPGPRRWAAPGTMGTGRALGEVQGGEAMQSRGPESPTLAMFTAGDFLGGHQAGVPALSPRTMVGTADDPRAPPYLLLSPTLVASGACRPRVSPKRTDRKGLCRCGHGLCPLRQQPLV